MLTYAETRPEPRQRAYVHAYWTWDAALPDGERFEHHVWPDGCISIAISRRAGAPPSGMIMGPCVEPRRLTMIGEVISRGVRFRPEAGAAVLGLHAPDLRERALPLADVIGDDAAALVQAVSAAETHRHGLALLRSWVGDRLHTAPPLDELVTRTVDGIRDSHGQVSMAAIAASLAISPRQLQRRFLGSVGLSPKQYARIRRLRSLLAMVMARDERWAAVAAASGYADQAHCARELARLTGLSPRALASRLRDIQHGDVDP